jgi:hypothetical protein
MAKMAILVTSRIEEGHRIGEVWQSAGAPGVTLIESYGLRRLQEASRSAEFLPGMISMLDFLRQNEETSLVIFSVADDESVVDRLLDATESILGDLTQPNTGVFFVVDVARAVGIRDHSKD